MKADPKRSDKPSQFDKDFKVAVRVLKRAAKRAQETAQRYKTPVVVWKDGHIKMVSPKIKAGK